jgi:hypothetical protein
MSLDRVYIDNMNDIILNVTHPSIHLQFHREDSEQVSAICDWPYKVTWIAGRSSLSIRISAWKLSSSTTSIFETILPHLAVYTSLKRW